MPNRLTTLLRNHFRNKFRLDNMQYTWPLGTFVAGWPDFSHTVVIVYACAGPKFLQPRTAGRDAGARLARCDNRAHTGFAQIDILRMGNIREMERVGRRAAQHTGLILD